MNVLATLAPVKETARKFGRVRLRHVTCSIGEVLDISGGGMRVCFRGSIDLPEKETFGINLQGLNGPVPLMVRLVWLRKTGWRTREAGLTFVDPGPELRKTLNDLARRITFEGEVPVDDLTLRTAA